MTIPQRKAHLKKLIDSVKDPAVLEKVAKVLEKPSQVIQQQSPMVKRALKAEADIRAGRIHPWEQVHVEMGKLIDDLYSDPQRVAERTKRSKSKG